ncbi:MAG TPA: inverse autotransporter beta domain-containing protein [Alphaproteobacteria bacterium]|jgi:hypothetical protein
MGAFRNLTQRRFITAFLASAALIALPVAAKAQSADKWGAHLDLEGKAGTDRNLGEGDLFLPLAQTDTTLVFGDMRMRFDDQESSEGNIGLGVRHMLSSGWNLGAYGYFDRRSTENDSIFSQATLGLEALSTDWDVRVNGYLPLGDDSRTLASTPGISTASLSGAIVQVVTTQGSFVEERALGGFDAEVGWRLPLFDAEADRQLRFYVGGYRFTADGLDDVTGPRARLDFTMQTVPFLWEGSRLTLGAEIQHDDPRGTQAFAGLRLRIPLQREDDAPTLTALEQRMTDTVVRDIDIVSQTRSASRGADIIEAATQTASGQALAVLDSATTTGANLPSAIAAAGANSTVLLSGTFATAATAALQPGQTVMGAGTLSVRTPSGYAATLTTAAAAVNGAIPGSNAPTFRLANDSTLTGLTISNVGAGVIPSPIGVDVDGISNATISNNSITVPDTFANGYGIQITNGSTGIKVLNNAFDVTSPGPAVGIALSASDATISDNSFSTASSGGVARAVSLGNPTGMSGSGNTILSGSTCGGFPGAGSLSFTNAPSC